MPDVGVLQLKISADASGASRSLKTLQTRLSEIHKTAATFSLGNVATEIENILKKVNTDKGGAARSLGSLLNALSAFSKVKSFGLTQKSLKTLSDLQTVTNGFKMGNTGTQLNKLREALAGDWDIEQAEKARDAMKTLSEGAQALNESGTQGKIGNILNSIKGLFGGKAKNIKESAADLDEYKNAVEEVQETVKDTPAKGSLMKVNLQQFGGTSKGGFAESTEKIKEVSTASVEATRNIKALIDHLNSKINYGKGSLADTVNNMLGISRPAMSESAKEGLVALWKPHIQQLEEAARKAEEIKEAEAKAASIRDIITKSIDVSTIPAMDKNGPFQFASEEIQDFTEKLNKAQKDVEFWSSEYAKIQKQIKYNGTTEAREGALGEAERSFYEATQAADEYKTKLDEVTKYKEEQLNIKINEAQQRATIKTDESKEVLKTNDALREQLRLKKEADLISDRARLEKQYEKYRDLFMNAGGNWKEQVPQIYSHVGFEFTPDIFEKAETFAEAMQMVQDAANQAKEATTEASTTEAASVERLGKNVQRTSTATRVLAGDLHDLMEESKSAGKENDETAFSMKRLGEAIKKTFPGISGLLNRFKQLVKYRMLRSVIKQIAEGFREGTENYYRYSQAIGGDFAISMDDAASSLLQMKNSIGAAAAPLITSLIPLLQSAVNWFIDLVNYGNQFLALMRGQSTWSRARKQEAKAFDDVKDSAKGAGAAVKDLLADWDELNIIQSESGGYGDPHGTKGMEDYLHMFEEVNEFDSRIRGIVEFIKNNLNQILMIAGGIGAMLLGWKLSKTFTDFLPWVAKLGTGIMAGGAIMISLGLTDMSGKAFAETGDVGWFLLDALGGAVGAEIAGDLVEKIAGGQAGEVTKGFVLMLEGVINIKNAVTAAEQEKKGEAFALGALGSIEMGIGTALATHGFGAGAAVSLAAGTVTGLATLAITIGLIVEAERKASYRRMAIEAFSSVGKRGLDADKYLQALQTKFDELTKGSNLVIDIGAEIGEHKEALQEAITSLTTLNGLVGGKEALTEEEAANFKAAWDVVIGELGDISKINYQTVYAGLDQAIANGSDKIRESALELRKQIIQTEGILNGARAAMQKEMQFLTNAIATGAATDEDLKRYEELYKILAQETDDGLAEFRAALARGTGFDFSGSDNPIQAALDFIKELNEKAQPTLETIRQEYETEAAAIQGQIDELNKMFAAGFVDEDKYNDSMTRLNNVLAFLQGRLADKEQEVADATQEAYDALFDQAMAGYATLDQNDLNATKAYLDNVLQPLVDTIVEAGGEVPEKVQTILASGGQNLLTINPDDLVRFTTRKSVYEAFFDQMLNGAIPDAETAAIAFEIDAVGGDTSQLTEEMQREIVNAMYEAFGGMPSMFEKLHATFGWDVQDMLNMIDTSGMDEEELSDLQDTANLLSAKFGVDLALPALDTTGIKESTNEAASAAEDMASRIRGAFMSLDGLSFSFNTGSNILNGVVKTLIPELPHAANGAIFKSGDVFSANENGSTEFIGRYGNKTGVVNNDQIVTGITRGVENGQGEQNSLLRRQNEILIQLLNKKFVASVSPSSGLGRVGQLSADAYSRVSGV